MTQHRRTTGERARVLPVEIVAQLEQQLPTVADDALEAVTTEVPAYAGQWRGELAQIIASAITLAMGVFLELLDEDADGRPDSPLEAARQGAYDLGRGEAKAGRSADALLSAYRIGARVAWQSMSATVVDAGVAPDAVAEFAALMFAYIDDLSASSVAGHTDQLARSGRVRQHRREQLAKALLTGAPSPRLTDLAADADWPTPETLTAVLIPSSRAREPLAQLGPDTLSIPADEVGIVATEPLNVLLVPDVVRTRSHVRAVLTGHGAVLGPARPWTRARESLALAVRARELSTSGNEALVDTRDHLDTLVVGADLGALRDLREDVLGPLEELTPTAAEKLTDTLRAWLTHLGRRAEVAEALHIHPQTVRYRMNQLRELYGDRLDDPAVVQRTVVALTLDPGQPSA